MNKIGILAAATVIILFVYELICCAIDPEWMWGKKPSKQAEETMAEEIAEYEEETPETAQIECETVHFDVVMGTDRPADIEDVIPQTTAEDEGPVIVTYLVDGCELDSELYEFLRVTLSSMGLEWYLPYALCQIYQESSFNPYAEASNGHDKGLLQYRLKYWDWENGDIFDPYAQLRVYCRTMHDKFQEGLSIYQVISDHYTGGVGYDENYVKDVVRWMDYVSIK